MTATHALQVTSGVISARNLVTTAKGVAAQHNTHHNLRIQSSLQNEPLTKAAKAIPKASAFRQSKHRSSGYTGIQQCCFRQYKQEYTTYRSLCCHQIRTVCWPNYKPTWQSGLWSIGKHPPSAHIQEDIPKLLDS